MVNGFYDNYLSSHSTLSKVNNYELMSAYYKKNYLDLLGEKNQRVLDVACGAGHFLYFLKKHGFHEIEAVDLCEECVDFCVQQGVIDQARIEKKDALDFFQHSVRVYDVIVMNDFLEHVEKGRIIETLAAARARMDAGGSLIVKVVNAANPITGASSRYGDFTHTIGFTQESLAQVLRMAGFSLVEIRPQDIWVFNPVVNLLGKTLQGIFNRLFRLFFLLYGRKTTTIFTKDLIAIAKH